MAALHNMRRCRADRNSTVRPHRGSISKRPRKVLTREDSTRRRSRPCRWKQQARTVLTNEISGLVRADAGACFVTALD